MGLLIAVGFGAVALALVATTVGATTSPGWRAVSLVVGATVSGCVVGLLFDVAFPKFASNAPRLLGVLFAGGLLGALPFIGYFGIGYALRPGSALRQPRASMIFGWILSLAAFLPYFFLVGLQAIVYLRCPGGSNAGECLFG